MPNTGNPTADAETYEQLKSAWMELHPSTSVTTVTAVTEPTAAENAIYEQNKSAQYQLGSGSFSQADVAAKQLEALKAAFNLHHDEWSNSNVRLYQAYIDLFTMARGHTIVSVTQASYDSFFPELKNLVDNNTALFTVIP